MKLAKESVLFIDVTGLQLPEERTELSLAFEMLEAENLRLLKEQRQGECTIQLFDRKGRLLIAETIEFPVNQDIEGLLMALVQSADQEDTLQVFKNDRPSRPKKKKMQREVKPKSERAKRDFHKLGKRILIGSILLLMIALIGGGITYVVTQATSKSGETAASQTSTSSTEKETLSELLKQGEYRQAAERYPDKKEQIVQFLSDQKLYEDLTTFNAAYPTSDGTFELAFHREDWKTVVSTESSQLSEKRQVMLAYAYIQLDRLEEAEILNQKLKSKTLSSEIDQHYFYRAIHFIQKAKFEEAGVIEKQLKKAELTELLETGKTCQEMIDFYKKKKDPENQKIWTNRLEQLGKEYLEAETVNK